jgi:SAM-dependent methyltransferase
MTSALDRYREIWDKKPVLRTVYADFFDRIVEVCVDGHTLEIGSGISNFTERMPEAIASDIQFGSDLDLVADAQRLPFADDFLGNIVMLDVLHHIEYPRLFLQRAAKSLRRGGRLVMIEPAITWGSSLFYRYVHPEPVNMLADPLALGEPDPARDPYDGNQAIPTLIATRDRERFHALMPELRIIKVEWFAFVVYPLSGGFKRWSLIPDGWVAPLLSFEHKLETKLGSILGFRMMLVIEKVSQP